MKQFMEERRALLNDTQSKISSQEKLLKAEILELRHQRTTLEDRLSQLTDDFQAMQAKANNLAILCRHVEQGRDEAVEGQNRLRGEIRLMKESFSQTFRQDTVRHTHSYYQGLSTHSHHILNTFSSHSNTFLSYCSTLLTNIFEHSLEQPIQHPF